MAELPRYQQTGRVFADLPQFDFSNVRESFQQSQRLAGNLDRLTGFANKFAAQVVEEEAEKWAVKNGYSYEQILEAQKQGITPDDLIASSGGGIVWQNTVRKIQGEQLRVEIEGLSRQELAKVQAAVETRQLTNDEEIAQKIDAIGKGLFAPLQSISPDAYVKGRNAYGLHAASVYNESKKQIVADIKAEAAVKADGNYASIMQLNKATIPNLNDIESINAAKDLTAQRVYEAYAESGNTALGLQMSQKARTEFDNQVANHLTKIAVDPSFATDAGEALNRIAKGDFKLADGKDYSAIYANETPENQAKIRAFIRQQYIEINTTTNDIEKNKIDELKGEVNNIELEYYKTKNPKLLNRLIQISRDSQGKAINATTIESIKKAADERESDIQYSEAVFTMKDELRRGKYDSQEQMFARGRELGVSRKAIIRYVGPSFLNKADALVDEILNNYADISNPNGSKAAKVRKRIAIQQEVDATYEAQFSTEGSDTKPKLSKAEIAGKLIDERIKGGNQKTAKVTALNTLAGKYNLPSFTSASSLDELTEQDIDRKVKDKKDREEIKKQLRELN
jgi:hypothetical protein